MKINWKSATLMGVILAALVITLFNFGNIVHAQAMGARPQIGPDQLRVIAASTSTDLLKMRLFASDGDNFYQVLPTGPLALSLGTGGALNLTSTTGTVSYPLYDVAMARQPGDGTYISTVAPGAKKMRVWRNGLLAVVGVSYTIDTANPSHILPTTAWSVNDTVTCDLLLIQ
jgi:hypothetical protein